MWGQCRGNIEKLCTKEKNWRAMRNEVMSLVRVEIDFRVGHGEGIE